MRIETERLVLRNLRLSDFEEHWKIISSPNIGPMTGGWNALTEEDKKGALRWLKIQTENPFSFAIISKENQTFIGFIGINETDKDYVQFSSNFENSIEIGGWIAEQFWNNGYMTEAFQSLIKFSFEKLGVDEIFAGNYHPNVASEKMQIKAGMKKCGAISSSVVWYKTGEECKLIVHKILKTDFIKANNFSQCKIRIKGSVPKLKLYNQENDI